MAEEQEKTAEELAEEAAAQLAVGEKKEEQVPEEKVSVEKKEVPTPAPQGDVSERLTQALAQLNDRLKPGLTPEQREAEIKQVEATTGFTRVQLGSLQKLSIQANLGVHQELGRMKAKETLGDLAPALLEKVEEAMKNLPAEVQANPQAWVEASYLIIGKNAKTQAPAKPSGGVMGQGLVNPGTGSSGKPPAKSGKQYDANEQEIIRRYFKGDATEYEKTKASKNLREVTPASASPSGNAADRELTRLTGGNT